MSKNRIAWLRVIIGQFVLLRYVPGEDVDDELVPEEAEASKELGPTYRLFLPRPGGRSVSYDLTAMTHEEFVCLREFFMKAFEKVEPVVIERDRVAQHAFDQGDDSFARIYRQTPQLVFREGTVGPDDKSLWDRSEDLPSGDEAGSPDGGVRGDSDELAPEEPTDCGTTDNE